MHKNFITAEERVVIKSLFVSADHFLVSAAKIFVLAAHFSRKLLQYPKVARASVKLVFASS